MRQVPKVSVLDFKRKKKKGHKICMLTCYDYPSARIVAETPIDCVLVGDSVAMTVHGHETTVTATVEMMILHTAAVARGLSSQFLLTDLPFLSHKRSLAQTIKHVQKIMQAGAQAIKIEGADPHTLDTITYLVQAGIPVAGHIGLRPQSIHQLGGFKVQGRSKEQELMLMQHAQDLEQAGCFAVIIECVPQQLASTITQSLDIPTIGIGAGSGTDGQVLVWHDLLGLQTDFNPRFVKKFAQSKELFLEAIYAYTKQVQQAQFPALEHAF